jgi:hypothetical protein
MTTHRTLARRRRALTAGAAVLALTVLAACGDNGDDDPSPTAGSAAGSTEATPTGSATASATPPDEASEPAPRTAGEPVDPEDFLAIYQASVEQATSANVTMNQTASGLEGDGAIDLASDPVAMRMTATLASMGELELRLVDNVMYMKFAMLGDKFIAFDLDDPTNPLGSTFGEIVDPGAMIEAFADGIESVTYAGEEDVDGESMDHYTVVSDPSAMLEDMQLPEGTPPLDLPETQKIDVWFDGDGFFRRVVTDLGALGTTTLTYDDWGTDVDVEAPPTDQVTTMPGARAG